MTTKAAERFYEAEHLLKMDGLAVAVFNPLARPIVELPIIYGFNNGGSPGWYTAQLLAESGHGLGSHICSSEAYMPHDLGILEGTRPDRHETFRKHYPDGYRMEFVAGDPRGHAGLMAAYERSVALSNGAQGSEEGEK